MLRVLVCGGRDYRERQHAYDVLQAIHENTGICLIIEGGQRTYDERMKLVGGADAFAAEWAILRGVERRTFKADWRKHGRSAGPIRNQQMLDECRPDLVVAFPGGDGTADMVRRARAAGIEVRETR